MVNFFIWRSIVCCQKQIRAVLAPRLQMMMSDQVIYYETHKAVALRKPGWFQTWTRKISMCIYY